LLPQYRFLLPVFSLRLNKIEPARGQQSLRSRQFDGRERSLVVSRVPMRAILQEIRILRPKPAAKQKKAL
jgi:hypothetical protein